MDELAEALESEGLRERKKRLMRQLISDTATEMFLQRGFDAVRVSEVAAACGVSEKTVYNYFPTKESLILDREEDMAAGIRRALGPGADRPPIEAALHLIEADLDGMFAEFSSDRDLDLGMITRFGDLFDETPSLRAAERDMASRLTQIVADSLAARAGVNPEDPEPQIAAAALMGLWRVEFLSMRRHAAGATTPESVKALVLSDVRRAARLIDTGLWSFGMMVVGSNNQAAVKAAAAASNDARKQVLAAMKQAKEAWKQVMSDADRVRGREQAAELRRLDHIRRRQGLKGPPSANA